MKLSTSLTLISGAAYVTAHGGVLQYKIGSAYFNGYLPYNPPSVQKPSIQREWDTYEPILDPTQSSLVCNTAGTVGALTATISAGSQITALWNAPWPHTLGPLVVWMAQCPGSCTSTTPSGAAWFKIDQSGLISGTLSTGLWGQGQMVNQNSTWTSTIPANLAPGNYLIRHELIALHQSNAPQWYPECGQLVVTGSGKQTPSSSYKASIPGVYSMSDPNINIDVYSNANSQKTTYTIPGPAVWTSN